jgi:hypothetical protein
VHLHFADSNLNGEASKEIQKSSFGGIIQVPFGNSISLLSPGGHFLEKNREEQYLRLFLYRRLNYNDIGFYERPSKYF